MRNVLIKMEHRSSHSAVENFHTSLRTLRLPMLQLRGDLCEHPRSIAASSHLRNPARTGLTGDAVRHSARRRENEMADPIELLIQGRAHELGPGFAVRRVLPSVKRRMVGPFIFLDHFGPMDVPPGGDGMEVRPHPHIGLATVTYLFDGGIFHRDSLGYAQAIRPGDVNWMTAGSGIAHSERTEPEMRRTGFRMHGVQTWVALPQAHEETAPAFEHVETARPADLDGRRRGAAADRRHLRRPHRADHALLADLLCRGGDAGGGQDRGLARA